MPKDPAKHLLTQKSWPRTRGVVARKDRASGQVVCLGRNEAGIREQTILHLAQKCTASGRTTQGVLLFFCLFVFGLVLSCFVLKQGLII